MPFFFGKQNQDIIPEPNHEVNIFFLKFPFGDFYIYLKQNLKGRKKFKHYYIKFP